MKGMKKFLIVGLCGVMFGVSVGAAPADVYLTQEEYDRLAQGVIYEEHGIVLENHPQLGYMVYRNGLGEEVVARYYSGEMSVEKQPYYEQEDRVGYIDELFPSFRFDIRDTTIGAIKPGDNVYLRMDGEGYVTYISAFNDYTVRYGRVHKWSLGGASMNTLILEDGMGKLYTYDIPQNTPITKAGGPYSLGRLKEGEWVRVLVSQKVLGHGVVEEEVMELVVDPDSRIISDVYRGELVATNSYQPMITMKDAQVLQKNGWGSYQSVVQLRLDPRTIQSYFMGKPVGYEYVANNLTRTDGYVYAAMESFMGKEQAVKLNFQTKKQVTLEPSTVTYASPGVVQLLSGEKLYIADDAIIVREDRLVGPASIMVGDTIQPVITGENKLAAARVMDTEVTGTLEVFRGRVKQIKDQKVFEVETFSLLQDGEWYFHPVARTFAIGPQTKFYDESGIVTDGIESFLTYGESSKESDVYTIIAKGDSAQMIVDMPYTKESIKGQVYKVEDGKAQINNVYVYDNDRERWRSLNGKNQTVSVEMLANTVVIKEGKLVSARAIEAGDELVVMMEENIYKQKPEGGDKPETDDKPDKPSGLNAKGLIIMVR